MNATRPVVHGGARFALRFAMGLALFGGASAGPAHALPAPQRWFGLSVLAGSTKFDPHFADYQWDTAPRPAFGAQAMAGFGRFGFGARLWRAQAEQQLNLAGASDPTVHATSLELVGEARVVSFAGLDVLARTHAGRVRLSYAPDHATVDAGGTPVEVRFAPVQEWIGGAGAAVRRELAGPWSAGLGLERQVFGMNTAHREGSATVFSRETFGDWNMRVEVTRVFAGKPGGSGR